MNEKIKNVLNAADKYLEDHEMEMLIHSLFTRDKTVQWIYRLRYTYKVWKSYYQKAAEKNALEKSKKTSVSE